jgi:hypothetical protein
MKLEAKTLVELKDKFRKKMKWSPRRNWTDEEQKFFDSKYEITIMKIDKEEGQDLFSILLPIQNFIPFGRVIKDLNNKNIREIEVLINSENFGFYLFRQKNEENESIENFIDNIENISDKIAVTVRQNKLLASYSLVSGLFQVDNKELDIHSPFVIILEIENIYASKFLNKNKSKIIKVQVY